MAHHKADGKDGISPPPIDKMSQTKDQVFIFNNHDKAWDDWECAVILQHEHLATPCVIPLPI